MKKRLFRKFFLLAGIIALHIMIAYVGLAFYYRNAFEYGTWINSIYCTGKSIEEVNEELSGQFYYDGITVYDKEQNVWRIPAQDIACQSDFKEALNLYLNRQNAWLWVDSFWKIRDEEIKPVVSYDEIKLEACFDTISCLTEETKEREFAIIKTPQGYELRNECVGVLDSEKAKDAIKEAILNAEPSVSLEEAGCYYDMELTEDMQEILQIWNQVQDFQNCGIIYQLGEDTIALDASVVCDWIKLAEDGSFALDEQGKIQLREEAIAEFIEDLAKEYDTVGGLRAFQTTTRGVIEVEGGTYGNKIDKEAEIAYLTEAFADKKEEIHTPLYVQTALKQGKDDIGDTYVEIDMGEQMMYYYQSGILQIETPVVTGNTSRRMGTPSGVNYVYLKQTNRILRGEGYASHVNFWMPVKGNIGIHDASWRSSYGGQIYQTNGSHGCINTPYEAMVKMYEMVEVGTPVVMYY
ncbi:MAG: L,D-transpeptidase/peptidoglycan binding protein [Ruminococcus sp.]|nr:L,D-transpeptidase/peptidoglycan binding protein [Ruminococcus sp.]